MQERKVLVHIPQDYHDDDDNETGTVLQFDTKA
jgi:hypothetical protein